MLDYDILVPGNYFCDLIFTGFRFFPELGREVYTDSLAVVPGGGALNTSVALARLGVRVGWTSVMGNDVFSRYIEDFVRQQGLDMRLVERIEQPMQRVTVALSFPQDRAFVTYVDASPDSILLALRACERASFRHLHFGGLMIDERILSLMDVCAARGATISMDCQERIQTLETPLVREILSRLTIFLPNAHEAMKLTQTSDLNDAIGALSALCRHLVIKQGAGGAVAITHGEPRFSPAITLTSPIVDTTGAGDVFNAGYLAAYLEGRSTEDCLRWGNFCGGHSVQGMGGTSTAPTRAQLDAWFAGSRGPVQGNG